MPERLINCVVERGKDEGAKVLEKISILEWRGVFIFSPYTVLIR